MEPRAEFQSAECLQIAIGGQRRDLLDLKPKTAGKDEFLSGMPARVRRAQAAARRT